MVIVGRVINTTDTTSLALVRQLNLPQQIIPFYPIALLLYCPIALLNTHLLIFQGQ